MAIMANYNQPMIHRYIKPGYAKTQATCQGKVLDAAFTADKGDIVPGSVMSLLGNGRVTLCDGTMEPWGLSDNFCSPATGIDEVRANGQNLIGVWKGGSDSEFFIEAPAYDATAAWADQVAVLDTGKPVYLKSNDKGLLTLEAEVSTATANTICKLVAVEGKTLTVAFI